MPNADHAAVDLIAAAEALARQAHEGQTHADGACPYIVHPARVAARLACRFPADDALIAAGWCHDVLEDCPSMSEELLRASIGDDAASLVAQVTNPSKRHPTLPRAARKAMDRDHCRTISIRARCLKLADRADNLRDACSRSDPAWIAQYVAESRLLAEILRSADGDLARDLDEALEAAARAAAPTARR